MAVQGPQIPISSEICPDCSDELNNRLLFCFKQRSVDFPLIDGNFVFLAPLSEMPEVGPCS